MEAIIFDYDGTLGHLNIDFGNMRHDVEELLAVHGIAPGGLEEYYILEMIDEATKLLSDQNPSKGASFYRRSMDIVTDHELRAAKDGKLLPGVIDMFEQLGQQGIKTGIITRNCDRAVKIVFPRIESFCDVYIPRDGVTRVKPHPDHLALTLKRLAVQPTANCLMVGDHISDIEAGKRLDMKTAGVLTGNTSRHHFIEAGADLILDDATKILKYIF